MMFILNRLRGGAFNEKLRIPWSKVIGVLLGLLFYQIDHNLYYSIAIAILYTLGESYGWGVWISVLGYNMLPKNGGRLPDEGGHSGIQRITELFFNPSRDYKKFAFMALSLRGLWWFGPILYLLFYGGYISFGQLVYTLIISSVGFPLSFVLARKTARIEKIKFKEFRTPWEQGEVIYGLMQDICLVLLFIL